MQVENLEISGGIVEGSKDGLNTTPQMHGH